MVVELKLRQNLSRGIFSRRGGELLDRDVSLFCRESIFKKLCFFNDNFALNVLLHG